jgi:hypothetical protein
MRDPGGVQPKKVRILRHHNTAFLNRSLQVPSIVGCM